MDYNSLFTSIKKQGKEIGQQLKYKETYNQINRQSDKQTIRQTDNQINRQSDKQTIK